MALRGKKPQQKNLRLKALLYGPAGVGKTTAAIQMPKPYIIDTEMGTSHYGDLIEKCGGAVFQTNSMADAIDEIRSLATEKHDFLTLVVDPFTGLYDTELEKGEKMVGSDFGRHYGYANKAAKRLYNIVSQLDMNVIFTCHSKNEYGDNMKIIGQTFDGWKKLDYLFDVAFCLERGSSRKDRIATVRKSRINEFPDMDKFNWSYEELVARYGANKLEKAADQIKLASKKVIAEFKGLYNKLTEDARKEIGVNKAISSLDELADMPEERIQKGIDLMRKHLS